MTVRIAPSGSRQNHPLSNSPPPSATQAVGSTSGVRLACSAHKDTKIKRILTELAHGVSLHRFQAERLGDHVLHSTVSKIQEYGIQVEREWITVPGFSGHPTRVCRYWINDENRERAARLLGFANGT